VRATEAAPFLAVTTTGDTATFAQGYDGPP
jgi:hypothetical protein